MAWDEPGLLLTTISGKVCVCVCEREREIKDTMELKPKFNNLFY